MRFLLQLSLMAVLSFQVFAMNASGDPFDSMDPTYRAPKPVWGEPALLSDRVTPAHEEPSVMSGYEPFRTVIPKGDIFPRGGDSAIPGWQPCAGLF